MSCAEIGSIIPSSTWRLDALEVSLATIFGAILGVILAVITSRCFVKELARSRVQKSQDDTAVKNATYEARVAGYSEMTYRKTKTTTVSEKRNHLTVMQEDSSGEEEDDDEGYGRKKVKEDETEEEDEGYEEDGGMAVHTGIIIALTKPTNEKTMTELSLQDFHATKAMERELQQEREWVFIYLLRILLGKFVAAEKLEEKYAEEFVETTTQEMMSTKDSLQAMQLAKEEELRKNSDLSKDPLAMEEALENSRLEYIRRMDSMVQDTMFKVKDRLSKDSGLTSEQVEAIMANVMENLATAEKMISQEQNRQAAILQERLAKQQALSEQYGQVTLREHKGNQTRARSVKEIANYLAEERELNQAQAKSLIKQYEADMEQIQENHKAAVLKHSQELAERLQQHREKKLRALDIKQAEEREKLAAKAPKVINPTDFVEAHHDLLEQQRNVKNDLMDELDYHEAEELRLLRKKLEDERVQELKEKENSLFEELVAKAQLNEKEAQRIVKKHESNVKAHNDQLDQEKKRQNMMLQEKLEKRKASWEEEQQRAAAEQQQLAEQQERTISKLIDTQAALDEEAKKQIMLQHEQNVTALNSHLQMTKLKQQKLLEAKLAKRRARYEALRARQEQEREARGEGEEDEDSKLQKKQREELEAEEAAMREEQQAAILVLRRQLALETEEMLKEQDARMGLLIGRLQVGQARRQGVIKKLDRAVKDLQDQLVDTLADSNAISERKTERIIATHIQEMEEIEEKLQHARAHQENQLKHKMETIRLNRERSLVNDLKQNETQVPTEGRRQSGADALNIMTRILENNRQKQAMRQLEQEMRVEALKQKEELNAQLEEALEEELKDRERDFLGQLAALSQISKEELNNMVQTTIAEKGGDESDARKLSKDLNKRLKNARTRPELDPNAEEEEEEEMRMEKPKKKKKGKRR